MIVVYLLYSKYGHLQGANFPLTAKILKFMLFHWLKDLAGTGR